MKRASARQERDFKNEAFAQEYAKRHQDMAERFGREYRDKLSVRGFRGGRIIDVGCGSGATALTLAKSFAESQIVGVDLSDPILRLANLSAQAAELGERVRFEKGDAQELPYEDDSFEVALNLNMVHLVSDPIRMLNEIERVLVPDGFLFIADLRRSWLGLIEAEIRSALTLEEAKDLFGRSQLRPGVFSSQLVWWRFETLYPFMQQTWTFLAYRRPKKSMSVL